MTIWRPILYLRRRKLHFPYYPSLKLSIPGNLNFPFSQHFDNTVKILKYSILEHTLNKLMLPFNIAIPNYSIIIIIIIIFIIK